MPPEPSRGLLGACLMVKLVKKVDCCERHTAANQNKQYGVKRHGTSRWPQRLSLLDSW
jgi:hypothetical protein